jgi:hypothetical protein
MKHGVPSWLFAVLALGTLGAADPGRIVVEVEAGPLDRADTPVILAFPRGFETTPAVSLESLDDRQSVAAQWVPGNSPRLAWVVRDMKAGTRRRYRLISAKDKDATSGSVVACLNDGRALTLQARDRPVLRYNAALVESPAGLDPVYRRSGYIHPLYTPSARVVTGDFCPQHPHQHGFFFAWVNTTFNGHKVDFWNQKAETGRVRHLETLRTTGGPVFGQFTVKLRHEDITGQTHVAVLDELWTVRAYDLATPGRFLFDFESRQTCVADKPLSVNTYHYGGLGLRGNTAWLDPDAKGNDPPRPEHSNRSDFLTSEGKTRVDGNHTRPRWADLSGELDGKVAGVTILDHPENFRFPQPVRLHPNMPYFCFAPMVPGGFAIEPGQSYVSRYRVSVHDGKPAPADVDRLWRDYAEPPLVRIVSGE